MRTNGFREDGALSLNAHQLGAATVYLGLAVRSRARAGSPRLRLPSPGAVSPVPTLTPHRSALPRALAQLGFYFLQAPAMEDGAVRLALEVAYACVCGVVTAAFYKAASTDPADDTRLQVRDERTHEREAIDARSPTASSSLPTSRALITAPHPPPPYLDPSRAPQTPRPRAEFFCNLCAYNVARGSKHCRACDKCVLHFDHHCKWLNNCVGSKNYHSFFLLVSTVLFQVLAQMAAGAYLLRWALVDKADASASLADVSTFPLRASVNHQEFVVFLVAYLFAGVCLGYLVGDLFVFHLVLMRRGITTFDYITSQREKKAEEGSSSRDGGGGGGSEEEDEFDDQSFSDATAAKGGAVCAECRGVASRRVNPVKTGRVDRRKRRSSGARVGLSCWALAFADVEKPPAAGAARLGEETDADDRAAKGIQPVQATGRRGG